MPSTLVRSTPPTTHAGNVLSRIPAPVPAHLPPHARQRQRSGRRDGVRHGQFYHRPGDSAGIGAERSGPHPRLEARQQVVLRTGRQHERMVPACAFCRWRVGFHPAVGATKRGGSLLFGASWTVDTGSGLDDKCVFVTDQGEVVIFAGTDPTASASWRQEGCYDISRPLGKNAHVKLGGDILVATLDGIVPLSATMQKDVSALSLAAITYNIEPMWTREFLNKRTYPWMLAKWDEGSALLVSFPGDASPTLGIPTTVGATVGVSNLHTGAWCALYRLGRHVLHATAWLAVLWHAGRQDYAGRKHRER